MASRLDSEPSSPAVCAVVALIGIAVAVGLLLVALVFPGVASEPRLYDGHSTTGQSIEVCKPLVGPIVPGTERPCLMQ